MNEATEMSSCDFACCRYSEIVRKFFVALPCGFLEVFLGHYLSVHAMMNLGAELTRFADRQFYTVRGKQFLPTFIPKCMYIINVEFFTVNKFSLIALRDESKNTKLFRHRIIDVI